MTYNPSTNGQATLVGGAKVVADSKITSSSTVLVANNSVGGTLGILSVSLNPGVGFTINSSNVLDTSVIKYIINY